MPAVKAHHQKSKDLRKPSTIYGHHFGMLGILLGTVSQKLCAPLSLRIHEGAEEIARWKNQEPLGRCERLIREALSICQNRRRSFYLLLDRDFMNKNGIQAVLEHNAESKTKLDLVGCCKNNVICRRELSESEKEFQKKKNTVVVQENILIRSNLSPGLRIIGTGSGKPNSPMALLYRF